MNKPELLAPAGSMDALKAAVFAGADAIYIGGKEFNARKNAGNFDNNEIGEAVIFCHLFDVKVYVAINILIKDSEIESVLKYVQLLYDNNVDGIIVQDLGLFHLIRRNFPMLNIHSSTQMFIHSIHGVHLLEEIGFDRTVLARELTLKEIKYIVDNSKKEIKIFNHGAMCICYSGQCLMSSMIGGRSGNRGTCAQPCRKRYSLYNNSNKLDEGHLLSPKDLNTLDIFTELIDTGVHSFKIEGRKKNKIYVYTIVSAYRKLMDSYIKDNKHEIITNDEKNKVYQSFNREFSNGYFLKDKVAAEELINKEIPKNMGVFTGKVIQVTNDGAKIKLNAHLSQGDGIRIINGNKETGQKITKIFKNGNQVQNAYSGDTIFISGKSLNKGDLIYKIADISLKNEIEILIDKKYPRKIPVEGKFSLRENGFLTGEITKDQVVIKYQSKVKSEKAVNKAISKDRIIQQLNKLGETPYYFKKIDIHMDDNIVIPISAVNEARREMMDELTKKIINLNRKPIKEKFDLYYKAHERSIEKPKISVKTHRFDLIEEIIKENIDEVIFGGDILFDNKQIENVLNMCVRNNKSLRLAFPRVTRMEYLKELKLHLNWLKNLPIVGVLISNYELLDLFRTTNINIHIDHTFNIMNKYTLDILGSLGVSLGYLSQELNMGEIKSFIDDSPINIGMVVYGNTELMISQYKLWDRNCSIEDIRGYSFPVIIDDFQRSHIYNSKTTSLLDELYRLDGIQNIRLDFTNEQPKEVVRVIENALLALNHGEINSDLTTKNLNITKGHFNRGV